MQENQPITKTPFHGLVLDDGRTFTNWGLSRSTRPAVYLEPVSYADVQAAVRDDKRFPSPIHPVGSMHSVTSTIVNDGGTLLCTRKLDEVIGLEHDPTGRQVVRVQAGCRLKKLNMWLQAHGVEIPFQAEIGEATEDSEETGAPEVHHQILRTVSGLAAEGAQGQTKASARGQDTSNFSGTGGRSYRAAGGALLATARMRGKNI
jgi:FAD/FMN-containing dehydrogenase